MIHPNVFQHDRAIAAEDIRKLYLLDGFCVLRAAGVTHRGLLDSLRTKRIGGPPREIYGEIVDNF
jgi:hypothetical protein